MKIHLQKELDQLKQKLFHLSALVEEIFTLSVRAVLAGEAQAGKAAREQDIEIDKLEVEVEEDCLKILALHQPVAVDLRFLITALKMTNDLERIGDLAVNIANVSACREGKPMPDDLGGAMQALAEKSRAMLRLTLESLMEMSADGAHKVLADDDEVDAMYLRFSRTIKAQLAERPADHGDLISWLMAAKSVERVADHATNIAEDTIYSVNGEIIRHGLGPDPEQGLPDN